MTHILVDANNLFFRTFNSVGKGQDLDTQIGYSFHTLFYSMRKVWNLFEGSHVVLCLDGGSWRRQYSTSYKRNRDEIRLNLSDKEKEQNEIVREDLDAFIKYAKEKTNLTVLHASGLEADDLIAFWIEAHPDNKHVIISTDGDFKQLISPNVAQFAGVDKNLYLDPESALFEKIQNRKFKDKDIVIKSFGEPEYYLFEKCIRGDKSDNIFSAYPRVRQNKIREAFDDRERQGFAWNNFMLKKWIDHNDQEHLVKDKYNENRLLIDLSMQPEEIRMKGMKTILEATSKEPAKQVGVHFLKFCSLYNLNRITDQPNDFVKMLNAKYK